MCLHGASGTACTHSVSPVLASVRPCVPEWTGQTGMSVCVCARKRTGVCLPVGMRINACVYTFEQGGGACAPAYICMLLQFHREQVRPLAVLVASKTLCLGTHTHTHTSTRKHTSGHSPMRDAHVPTAEQGQQGCPGNPSAQVQSCGTSTQGSY